MSALHWLIIATCLILAAAHVVLIAKETWALSPTIRARLVRFVAALSRMPCPSRRAAERSEFEQAVHEKMFALRNTTLQMCVKFFSILCFFSALLVAYKRLGKVSRWMTSGQDVLMALAYMVFLAPQVHPALLQRSWAGEALHIIITASCALGFSPAFCDPDYVILVVFTVLPMVDALGLAMMNVGHVVVWQAALAVVFAVSSKLSDVGVNFYFLLPVIAFHYVSIVVVTASVQLGMAKTLRVELEAQALGEKQLAGHALLKAFYDVVIELDHDLKVTSGHEDLRLFLPKPGRSLMGIALEDLLPVEEDAHLLRDRISRAPEGADPTVDLMHVTIQEREQGEGVEVELFHFQFEGLSGRLRHLCGIREATLPENGSATSTETTPNAAAGLGGAVWVRVDVKALPMAILECSPGFIRETGLLDGEVALAPMLHNEKDVMGLLRWAQNIVSQQVSGNFEEEEVQQANHRRVVFRVRGHRRLRVCTRCWVDFDKCSQEELSQGHAVLHFGAFERMYVIGQEVATLERGSHGLGTPKHTGLGHTGHLQAARPTGNSVSL